VTGAVPEPPSNGTAGAPPSVEELRAVLRGVTDPELRDNIVDLGMLRDVGVTPEGEVTVEVALTVLGCPFRVQLRNDIDNRIAGLPGVRSLEVRIGVMTLEEKQHLMDRARRNAQKGAPGTDIPPGTRILAISSGKGGVGKSSVTVNLAAALAQRGLTVGILDADIWGFSVPRMLGMEGRHEAEGGKILPRERAVGSGRLRVVSMGFLAEEDTAIMWRGLLLNRALQQFLEDVQWGPLDYLLVDMPPGTGDVQMGLARMLPRTEVVVVTTPPVAAQKVAARAADMARKGHLRVVGVIENMSGFVCDHGVSYPLFGQGGGERLAEHLGVPLIAQVPLDPTVTAAGDTGIPVAEGTGRLSEVFADLAARITTEVAPRIDVDSCTARLLERMEAATSDQRRAADTAANVIS
jgi:ATP-binding protein involved in chromosome partitioning